MFTLIGDKGHTLYESAKGCSNFCLTLVIVAFCFTFTLEFKEISKEIHPNEYN